MWTVAALVLALQVPAFTPVPPETASVLRRAARRAESQYESVSRRLVPYTFDGGSSDGCDETVGRFCLTYDRPGVTQKPLAPEDRRITEVRRTAIEIFRRAFAAIPNDLRIIGPLVRYLVEDGRASEATAVARTFAWASADSVWGPMLLGFALHAEAHDSVAETQLDRALRHLAPEELKRATQLNALLSPGERTAYRKLNDAGRTAYHRRFWTLADALYATPGNQTRVEHLTRYAWSRILEKAPIVSSMTSWGSDVEELTMRYGVPRARFREASSPLGDTRLLERFDPASVAVVPESLVVRGMPRTPDPGAPWDLESMRARSGHAPTTVRHIVPMLHQVSRFPSGDSLLLRADGAFVLDSVAHDSVARAGSPRMARVHLFVVDSLSTVHALRADSILIGGDTVRFTLVGAMPPGADVYSVEAIEATSLQAARARYAFPGALPGGVRSTPTAVATPVLSDIVIAEPFEGALPTASVDPRLRGRARLLLEGADTIIGVYAEVSSLPPSADSTDAFNVELTLQRKSAPTVLTSAARWLGRRLGRDERTAGARVAWSAAAPRDGPLIIAVDVNLATTRPGLYDLTITVGSRGSSTTGTRRFRILDS
jgi:hypothetical protein